MGLIDLKKRIQSIKIKQLQNLDNNSVENDSLAYFMGWDMRKVFGTVAPGPKKEQCENKYRNTFNLMVKNASKLKSIKVLSTREIQQGIFPDQRTLVFDHIWKSEYSKHKAINYKTAYGLLPIVGRENCTFCGQETETTKHILLDCQKISEIRNKVRDWLNLLTPGIDLDKDLVISGVKIKDNVQRFILSEYKIAVWIARNKVKFEKHALNNAILINRIESNVRFYLCHYEGNK